MAFIPLEIAEGTIARALAGTAAKGLLHGGAAAIGAEAVKRAAPVVEHIIQDVFEHVHI